MLKTHKISEHQALSWDKFSCPHQAQKALTMLAEKSNFKPFSYTANGIKACHYVGVISLGGQMVEVLPKIFSDSEDHKANITNITGLMYLLKLSRKINLSETDMACLSQQFDSLLEVFIYFFSHELFELLNNDFKASYVQQTENLNFVKGRIDFTHHIRHNHTNQAKFYCNYDEYDSNTIPNIF